MTNILSSPLFSIASTASANAAVAAQQALINAAASFAAGKTIGGINGNNYNQQILQSIPTNQLILEQKQMENSPQQLISTNCHIKNDQQTLTNMLDSGSSNGGLNASLSISQRNLQSLVLAIRHLEGAN
uniref:Uncharacterized protein n=1 Tax=Meloidogyne hapla TaxID=6305 RepID=A0A1I8C3W6_MELHA